MHKPCRAALNWTGEDIFPYVVLGGNNVGASVSLVPDARRRCTLGYRLNIWLIYQGFEMVQGLGYRQRIDLTPHALTRFERGL
jgi:hypothetical protein